MQLATTAYRFSPAAKPATASAYDDWLLLRALEEHLVAPRRIDFQSAHLKQLIEVLETRLARSQVARRAARGMGKLPNRLRSMARLGRSPLDRLTLLLETADDLTVQLVHPESGWRGRFYLTGIEGNRHFLEEAMPLLAECLGRSIAGNPFVGPLRRDRDGVALFHSPFALYANPDICRIVDADTRLHSPDRIWSAGSPRDFPVVDGVPTAYLGLPADAVEWRRERLFPEMASRIEMLG